ncbi:MAG: nuclear transport factor 2 family protein [Pseudomonadales bacterium]|nr:nuclear transport factor 2 family protein [Pseudomonadales bacterium]
MTNNVADKLAIYDLVFKYCRAVDRRDFASLAALYHEDSIDDHGGMFKGTGKEFVVWLPEVLSGMKVTSHTVTNHLVTVQGNQAEGEVYCNAYHLTPDNTEIIIGGRYLDKYIKENGQWYFKHRKIVMDWNQIKPSSCDMNSPVVQGTDVGDVFDKDPTHEFFEFLKTD